MPPTRLKRLTLIVPALTLGATAWGQGGAIFQTSGPATTGPSGMWGDAMLDAVEFPTGDVFTDFITAKAVTRFESPTSFSGLGWSVSTGTACTTGQPGWFKVQDMDGNSGSISAQDRELFGVMMTDVLNDRNLNSLVHLKSSGASFMIEFNELIRDNDPGTDAFGEILYFERGAGAGNSTVYIQAVDETGTALGPLVTIDGNETLTTTPMTTIGTPWATSLTNQTMGGATVDLTRLGVEELRFLRVYNGQSDPDLKIFAVWTQPKRPDPIALFD